MAGYSKTPLSRKLGIREDHRLRLVGAPWGFDGLLAPLPPGVRRLASGRGPIDVAVLFARNAAALRRSFPGLTRRLAPAGGLWVAWPKKSSGVETDLDFSVVQTHGLGAGLVDNKICAIDETWSGLRFVIRRADR